MRFLTLCCALLLISNASFADDESTTIVKTGAIGEDTYLVGKRVKVNATVDGDLLLAAADIDVAGAVSGDLMAAGADVSITAELADDVRVAGASVSLCSTVTGDAFLAGGKVELCSTSIVGNKAWVAGGDVTIDGRVENDLSVRAGNVRLAGVFLKDVNIEATSIEILEDTEIMGDLVYKSPSPADIHDGADIRGEENYVIAEPWWNDKDGDWSAADTVKVGLGIFTVVVLSTLLTGFTLSAFLPQTYSNTNRAIRSKSLQCIAAGLLLTLITPAVLVILAVTIIAIPLVWIGLLLYLLLLAIGGYAGLLFIADTLFRSVKGDQAHSKASKILSILVAIVVLLLVSFIPLIGGIALFLVYISGVGALCLCLIEYRKQHQQRSIQPEK